MKKLIFSIIILGIILAIIGFWYWQRSSYSKDILKLEILGPNEAEIGQEIEYTVKYKNNGNVRLEEPKLIFELPEHSILNEGNARRQEVGSEELGDIYPGEEKTFKFSARLFGKENETKTAKAQISFKPKNLTASYQSETTFTTVIKSVPLTFDFDLPSKIEGGRDFSFSLNYFSNLDYPLSNLGIKIEYPNGFEFISSSPKTLEKTEWDISLLNKTDGGRIEIKGRLSGNTDEQKVFKALLGIWIEDDFIALKETSKGIAIVQPSLDIFQRINNQDQYLASAGDSLHYEIFFRNISESPFQELFMVVQLKGKIFDFNSIRSDFGRFNKGDNSIIWDWRDVSKLNFLGQGEEGKVEFWVSLKNDWQISSPQEKNLIIKNSVLVSQIKEEFETKVNSKLAISQQGYYLHDLFDNFGPNPPQAGKATTYTIVWEAKNYYNDAKNVKVKAILPPNVSLTGKIYPESEASKFFFDSVSREIVWSVSDGSGLSAGAGILNPSPNISFQVSLTPLANQTGQIMPIIGQAKISGEDQFTQQKTEGVSSAVDTNSAR